LNFRDKRVLFDHRKVLRWLILDGEIWGLEILRDDWAVIEKPFREAMRHE